MGTNFARVAARMYMTQEERDQDTARVKARAEEKRQIKARRRQIRKDLIDKQDRRCPVCDLEIELDKKGACVYLHQQSGLILCHGCWWLVLHMDRKRGRVLDQAVKLVADYPGCAKRRPVVEEKEEKTKYIPGKRRD